MLGHVKHAYLIKEIKGVLDVALDILSNWHVVNLLHQRYNASQSLLRVLDILISAPTDQIIELFVGEHPLPCLNWSTEKSQ